MPFFVYKGYTAEGKEVKEIEEAPSVSVLRKKLLKKGIIPYEIKHITQKKRRLSLSFEWNKKTLSDEELSILLYEIGVLLQKNIHITEVFEIISGQSENYKIRESLLLIKTRLQEGKPLSEALKESKLFPEFFVEMVKAGELSGALDTIFLSASEFIENMGNFKTKVLNSIIYPIIVILISFLAMIIILNIVVPTISNIYSQFGKELPLSTKFIIYFSTGFNTVIKFIPLIAAIAFIYRKKYLTKEKIDSLKLKLPIFSKIYLYTRYSTWSNTLSIMIKGGVTLEKSLEIAAKTLNNTVLQKKFERILQEVKKGKRLSNLFKEEKLLPENIIQIISIGEETGDLEGMFGLISKIYKKQAEKQISLFLGYLEPAILIVLSVFIGFFVFATLLPIFNLNIR